MVARTIVLLRLLLTTNGLITNSSERASVPSDGLWFHLSACTLAEQFADGDKVHTWAAVDGSGKDVVAYDSNEDITFKAVGDYSGRPVGLFTDAVSAHMMCTQNSYDVLQELTIFWKGTFTSSNRVAYSTLVGQSSNTHWELRKYHTQNMITMHTRNSNNPYTAFNEDTPIIIVGTSTQSGSSIDRTIKVYNAADKSLFSENSNTDSNTIPTGNYPICIGNEPTWHPGPSNSFRGEYEDVLVYDRKLPDSEIDTVIDALHMSSCIGKYPPAPTPNPTQAPPPSAGAGSSPASAKGDPHLQNINGQRFDLMRPGKHVLLHIPRGADAPHVLLRVEAEVQRLGQQCGDMYFQHVNITGAWVEAKHNGILQFHAGEAGGAEGPTWMAFGAVQLKVVRVHWQGIHYLNLFAKHLGRTGFTVGGLLGEDDHTYEATPDHDCVPTLNLNLHGTMMGLHSASPSTPPASSAEASLA